MTEILLDAKGQHRLEILVQWAAEAALAGHQVPEHADLQIIAHTKLVTVEGIGGSVVQLWESTISWMLKQAAFGVMDPFRHLPEELLSPAGIATPGPAVVAEETVEVVEVLPKATASSKLPKWEAAAREQVREAIKRYTKPLHDLKARDANEGDTRLVVTDILCEGLDYDKFRDLTTEYMVKQDFADYGVRIDKQLVAFIEVKRISQKLNERHLRQVQMYAVNEGIEWMVLTNGAVWQAYHLTGGLPIIINMAFEIDLLGPESLEEKSELMFLLHREALKRRRIDESWKHRAATEPKALLELILSDALLEQIRKEVKRRTGITTTPEALSEVITTEIVDPKLMAKLYKS